MPNAPTGGYFLDITPNREAAARYGLTVGDINDVIETAIGGKTIATDQPKAASVIPSAYVTRGIFATDSDALKRVLVPIPMSARGTPSRDRERPSRQARKFRWGSLADFRYQDRPAVYPHNENGQLVGFVLVDPCVWRHWRWRAEGVEAHQRTRHISAGLLYAMGRSVRVSPGGGAQVDGRHPIHPSHYLRADLSQHEIGDENRNRDSCSPVLTRRRFFADLFAALQFKRGRCGWLDCAGRIRCRNGHRDALLYLDHAWEKFRAAGKMATHVAICTTPFIEVRGPTHPARKS